MAAPAAEFVTLTLRLPKPIYDKLVAIAERDGVTVEDLVVTAIAELLDELS